jgi:hypothetical protein
MKARPISLIMLVLLTCLAVFSLGATKGSSKATWEYKVAYHNHYKAEEELNKLGAQGWELIALSPASFVDDQSGTKREGNIYFFKRLK